MFQDNYNASTFSWRSLGALFLFCSAIIGFELGVGVTERPDVIHAGILTKAYYSLSLFVVGGVDLGTPDGGPLIGRIMLWTSYFGSPMLAAWTLIEALLRSRAQSWYLRHLRDHIVVAGDGELAMATIRALRLVNAKIPLVVVSQSPDRAVSDELNEDLGATVVTGDITHEYFLKRLRVKRQRQR